ncbi:NAD(P)H-binding protein [Nocardioides sp. TF02-7]|uniref:SDR family oxidoreductase n=1 Tax=Nocardioides sp. TF02-7 TaxID=2917724 RepID=UPI001F053BCB|nr:NAD(P)H-binding protein [Nocardioides sp. TF02-7]UMG94133.1 NAD(P)H-binding protein [Nocardioides sp. TF02-7]
MRIAIAGATGNIGARVSLALRQDGHDVVALSRGAGVDLLTGAGVDGVLAGVDAVIDVTNVLTAERAEAQRHFATMTKALLAAEQVAGVGHHVLLSIAGVHRVDGNAHYAGKRLQEELVEAGPVPWTIVPATQFYDFAMMVTGWTEQDGVAPIAPC